MKGPGAIAAKVRDRLPRSGRLGLFLRIGAWLAALPVLFYLLPLPALMRLLTPRAAGLQPAPANHDPAAATEPACAEAMRILNLNPRFRRRGACLPRSFILYRYARLAGFPAVFFLGVRLEGDATVGHSWVEVHGRHLHDPQAQIPYKVTFSYPPPPG